MTSSIASLLLFLENTIQAGLKIDIKKTKIKASGPVTSWQIEGENWKQWQILFSWAPKSPWTMTAAMKLRHLLLGRKAMTNLDSVLKSRGITLLTKVHIIKAMVFPVVMYGCENWTKKKAEHWRIYAFELWSWRRLLSPLDSKEIKSISPKGNQPWKFIGRTDVEAEAPVVWPPDAKRQLIWKDPNAGKDWRQKKKGVAEDEMVR